MEDASHLRPVMTYSPNVYVFVWFPPRFLYHDKNLPHLAIDLHVTEADDAIGEDEIA